MNRSKRIERLPLRSISLTVVRQKLELREDHWEE